MIEKNFLTLIRKNRIFINILDFSALQDILKNNTEIDEKLLTFSRKLRIKIKELIDEKTSSFN